MLFSLSALGRPGSLAATAAAVRLLIRRRRMLFGGGGGGGGGSSLKLTDFSKLTLFLPPP
jgi:hypothetical protein